VVEFPFGKPVAFVSRSTKTLPRLYVHSGTMLIRAMESAQGAGLSASILPLINLAGLEKQG
jgi:hypothetical protein